ncbi:nuclear transport factor 2 family protein [Roseibium sp.]|uniref:nuclear transport factor 2 family protein n=1 Tax=Roseibium sp. TaxID=1936156 RepID=UPI003BAAE309
MKQIYKDTLFAAGLSLLIAIGIVAAYVLPVAAGSDQNQLEAEIRAVYGEFMDAQNARDLDRAGSFFIDGPDFLWVSDGRSVWGREATLERMGNFQKAAVWTVHPELELARIIRLGPETAMLHFPLVLEIGQEANPNRLGFLVSALFVRNGDDWRIASLLTTGRK